MMANQPCSWIIYSEPPEINPWIPTAAGTGSSAGLLPMGPLPLDWKMPAELSKILSFAAGVAISHENMRILNMGLIDFEIIDRCVFYMFLF